MFDNFKLSTEIDRMNYPERINNKIFLSMYKTINMNRKYYKDARGSNNRKLMKKMKSYNDEAQHDQNN